ncbi:MAG: hypothetical protein ACI8Y9_001248 [Paracoccaceae bacterium]|jgi:hypothetical protein
MNKGKNFSTSNTRVTIRGFDDYVLRMGDLMRGERATLGKSLLNVQQDLKINAKYIAAIENYDKFVFNSSGFIPGYVKSYASYLGIDPEWAFSQFCNESGFEVIDALSASEKKPQKVKIGRGFNKFKNIDSNPFSIFKQSEKSFISRLEPEVYGSIAVLIILIGILSYGGSVVFRQIQQVSLVQIDQPFGSLSADLNSPLLEPMIVDRKPASNGFGDKPVMDNLYRADVLEKPILTPRDSKIGELIAELLKDVPVNQLKEIDINHPTLRPSVEVTKPTDSRITIFAVKPSFIQILSNDGTIVFDKILDQGEHYTISNSNSLMSLKAGRSGSVFFTIDSKIYGPLGAGNEIIKNVRLDIQYLLDKFNLADLKKDPILESIVVELDNKINPLDRVVE